MIKLGLIGHPVAHSLSPRMHQVALDACGLEGEYRLYPVPPLPEGQEELDKLIEAVRIGEINGVNVTIPHKRTVMPLLHELTSTAKSIGAVNTIFLRNLRLVGDNTDAPGFLADLFLRLSDYIKGKMDTPAALILGAGGSARAVAYALSQVGWHVSVAARREEQARELLSSVLQDLHTNPIALHLSADSLRRRIDSSPKIILIVNTTPLGMHPNIQANPWPDSVPIPAGAFIYDLVYNPRETAFIKAAQAAGLPSCSGIGMLVEQAALSFERWTGLPAPRLEMARSVDPDRLF